MESERFAFRWKEFNSSIVSGFHESLVRGDLVDVTLAVEGQLIKAHRLVLSACSPYFRRMFTAMPENQHAIVFLKDVSHSLLMDLITFMYCGEINVQQEVLPILLSLAEALEIQGFSHHTFNESQKTLPVKQADTNVVIKTEPEDTCDNYAEEQEFIEIESSINSLCTEKSLDHSKQYNENLQRLRPNSPRIDQMNSTREESILIKSESEMEETITTGNTVSDWNINGLLDENFQTSSWDQGPSSSSNYIPHPVSQDIAESDNSSDNSEMFHWKQNYCHIQSNKKRRRPDEVFTQDSFTNNQSARPKGVLKDSHCKCKHDCMNKFSYAERLAINDLYWNLAGYSSQRYFILKNVSQKPCMHKRTVGVSRRQWSLEYSLNNKRVCKTFFLATLNISDSAVMNCMKKARTGTDVGEDSRNSSVNNIKYRYSFNQ